MAQPNDIHIGTSGWSYPRGEGTWKGHFYPKGKLDELEYYSRFFNTVEINSSFYRPPSPDTAKSWTSRVPDGFIFTAKLWQKFTHPAMYEQATGDEAAISARDVDIFKAGLEPLAAQGKLGALLAQFPPSFRNDALGQHILSAVGRTFAQYNLAVELRHRSWSDDPNTAQRLSDIKAAWVHIDEPRFSTSIARELPQTSQMAYFRFHSRNMAEWWRGDNETRYRYLYSDEEIAELAQEVSAAGRQAKLMFAFFNNHWQGYAPRNAVSMIQALNLAVKEIPIQPRLDIEEDKEADI
jgi:uncharacterized protein YecE (DUF72 family)